MWAAGAFLFLTPPMLCFHVICTCQGRVTMPGIIYVYCRIPETPQPWNGGLSLYHNQVHSPCLESWEMGPHFDRLKRGQEKVYAVEQAYYNKHII